MVWIVLRRDDVWRQYFSGLTNKYEESARCLERIIIQNTEALVRTSESTERAESVISSLGDIISTNTSVLDKMVAVAAKLDSITGVLEKIIMTNTVEIARAATITELRGIVKSMREEEKKKG